MNKWFTIDSIDKDTFIISEYKHYEETHCYLLNGSKKSILIDTGLGIANIFNEVRKLTDNEIVVIATHIHWDHIGGHKYFNKFYAHKNELKWLNGEFPLSLNQIKNMIYNCPNLPKEFNINDYNIFQGKPQKILKDKEIIDIGNRLIEVYHTPGHSPGHMCFLEKERGYLFTGDLVYKGCLFANYPSTNPQEYLDSLEKISNLPIKKIFPGHHSLDIKPEILIEIRNEFRKLKNKGILKHGTGKVDYKEWSVLL